jgi:non-specific serine/threonine protein kinase
LLRQFGREQLRTTTDGELAFGRLADEMIRLAEHASLHEMRSDVQASLRLLTDDIDNLRGALDWLSVRDDQRLCRLVIALVYFWFLRGALSEGQHWCRLALKLVPEGTEEKSRLLHGMATFANQMGAWDEAETYAEEALSLARKARTVWAEALATNILATVLFAKAEFGRALSLFQESLKLCQELGSAGRVGGTLQNIGVTQIEMGDQIGGRRSLEGCISSSQVSPRAAALARTNLGLLSLEQGDLGSSQTEFVRALRVFRELEDPIGISFTLMGLAALASEGGAPDRAILLAAAAEKLQASIFNRMPPSTHARLKVRMAVALQIVGTEAAELLHTQAAGMAIGAIIDYACDFRPSTPARTVGGHRTSPAGPSHVTDKETGAAELEHRTELP